MIHATEETQAVASEPGRPSRRTPRRLEALLRENLDAFALPLRVIEGGGAPGRGDEGRPALHLVRSPGALAGGPGGRNVSPSHPSLGTRSDAGRQREGERRDRVLIVDDDPLTLTAIGEAFRSRGFQVVEATTARKALQAAPNVDAIVLDIILPDRNGLEVLRSLRSEPATSDLPVVVLTGIGTHRLREQAVEAGCDSFLTKPPSLSALIGIFSDLGIGPSGEEG